MRMFMSVKIPVQAGNKAITENKIGPVMGGFAEKYQPSSMVFTTSNGMRTMYAVFDLADPSQIPALAEPFFLTLDAAVEILPAMDMGDLQKGMPAM
jgi:hypothetical protein